MWITFLSKKYFFSKRKEGMISLIGGISVLGVALGVAALIIVLSVMNGFDKEIKKKIIGTYAHVIIMKDGGIADYDQMITDLEEMPDIKTAAPFITGQAILRVDEAVVGILLKGIDPNKESAVSSVVEYAGTGVKDLKGYNIILGRELMRNEGIRSGEEIEIIIPYSAFDLAKTKLNVIGSFSSGRYDYDANIAITNIETAEKIFRMKDLVTGIGLRVDDEMDVNNLKAELQSEYKYPFIVKTWMDLDRNLVRALAMEKKMMFLILALIVMVACFNISGSLIMMVMEKTRDIGILKAVGANPRGISLLFFTEGAMIGVLGVATGTLIGLAISSRVNEVVAFAEKFTGFNLFPSDVYYFTEIPVAISRTDVTAVVSLAMVLTIAAGIYPAWKASRMDPVDAIRYE